jgi:DNA-binding transcriptional LysR family regulator
MDRMIEIATFVKTVEAGGFAAASRKLEMSPSTVTVHIQDLEQRLGARLLNRSTRKISLTEVGKAYYERCLQILADVARIKYCHSRRFCQVGQQKRFAVLQMGCAFVQFFCRGNKYVSPWRARRRSRPPS